MNNTATPEQLRHFNLETMSGIFPGTRTRRFYILKVSSVDDAGLLQEKSAVWAKAFWFEEPAMVVVSEPSGSVLAQVDNPDTNNLDEEIVFELIHQTLQKNNRQLISCGTCIHWQQYSATNNEQPFLGGCGWQLQPNEENQPPPTIAPNRLTRDLHLQSALALSCIYWQPILETFKASQLTPDIVSTTDNSTKRDFGVDTELDVNLASPTAIGSSWMQKVRQRLGLVKKQPKKSRVEQSRSGQNLADQNKRDFSLEQLDRSGVGAGTEPCLGCYGRIANLGALIVKTDEGDSQTYSVWRCRVCATTYLNSWVDRWERLDNLETEETLYRLAPMEAVYLLERIHGVVGGDHPQQSSERTQDRLWFESFLKDRCVLSHQVRRGR